MRRPRLRAGMLAAIAAALALLAGVMCARVAADPLVPAGRERVIAQLGLGSLTNALGAGKDLAVKAALSSFGTSLGDQLPIVVRSGDAYPTVPALPGPPFAPGATPDVAGALRSSRDGTIALEPGDYTFPVGVFCMRATAGSPSGHRYLVAPLRGSAADIITALDARIPSYALDHHVLQVLSWDIQAGMAYSAMQPAQRAAVDRIIPEYRGRLGGDVYERIRDQYSQAAQHVPGMPSFEDALTRIGPVGAQVVALQNLRQQLEQPPPTFEQLAHALVPMVPAGSAPDPAGETPWSRYSDRVYVRFTTAGDYSTPGTYQVRVVSPPRAASSAPVVAAGAASNGAVTGAGAAASVPFSNVVNNPGTDTVQPLTQTPLAPPAPAPAPAPRKRKWIAKITSETVAYTPTDRARRLVGVGEEVTLRFFVAPDDGATQPKWTPETAEWSVSRSDGDGKVEPFGDNVTYSASSVGARETITAQSSMASASIAFTVIPPASVVQKATAADVMHMEGRPTIGFRAKVYLAPDNVSFKFIQVIERHACAVATGVFAAKNGTDHLPNPRPLKIGEVYAGLGSQVLIDATTPAIDRNYSGDTPDLSPPFAPGSMTFAIPWEYQLVSGGNFHPFATVHVVFTLAPDGRTLIASKGGAFVSARIDDATMNPPPPDGPAQPANPCPR